MNECEGKRIVLRAPEPEDLEALLAVENDERLWEVGTATGPYSRFQMKRYLTDVQNDLYADRQLRLMIQHEREGVVGIIDLCYFDPRHNRAEIGLVVREDMRRKGIAHEALRRLERHCFCLLGIHQLYAYVLSDNVPSLGLFRASGYEETARLKDWVKTGSVYRDVCLFQKINPMDSQLKEG